MASHILVRLSLVHNPSSDQLASPFRRGIVVALQARMRGPRAMSDQEKAAELARLRDYLADMESGTRVGGA
jgi:hypothetical protein